MKFLASADTVGLLGNWTSVAFKIMFSSRIVAWDWLWPNGWKKSSIIENLVKSLTGQNYLFAVKTLVENDTEWPNVNFWRYFWRCFAHHKAFWWQVPVGSCSLRRQIHAMIWIVIFRIHDFGQTEIRDFDVTAHGAAGQQNISWNKWKIDLFWKLKKCGRFLPGLRS